MADAPTRWRGGPDQSVWEACAGNTGKMPAVGSLVYYFPQGHGEQAYAMPDFSSLYSETACFLCKVKEIQLLASEATDEVYSVVELDPCTAGWEPNTDCFPSKEDAGEEKSCVLSFAKVLTPSDANNGGGFSVPRFCADSIFPKLDFSVEPPAQVLNFRDLHGRAWEFRHIFRGTPRRHLLTTGWSKFVNSKRLMAGDSVVFSKNKAGELFIGLRRTSPSFGPSCPSHSPPQPGSPARPATRLAENFRIPAGAPRNWKGKISPEDVAEAAKLAERGRPFKIVYYPRVGSSNFVVEKGTVEAALQVPWSVGTRVKMSVETEDPSKTTWLQGTLSCILRHPPPFVCSPWRALEITWDEPDALYSVKRVSPWQVELLAGLHAAASHPFSAAKKARTGEQSQESGGAEKRKMLFPLQLLPGSAQAEAFVFSDRASPAGMQGARQDQMFKFLQPSVSDRLPGGAAAPAAKNGGGSFQLFGKTIQTGHLAAAEAAVGVDGEGEDAVDLPYNFSLSNQSKQFCEEADNPAPRVPAL